MIHEAFIYSTENEYAEVLAPFLRAALAADSGAVAVSSPDRIGVLREALGPDQRSVSFFDADEWYSRPGEAFTRWRTELHGRKDIHIVGEVPFKGDASSVARWTRYESLFNRAFADCAAWVVCPYDAGRLTQQIVSGARHTHPVVSTVLGRAPSPEHFGARELGAALSPSVARAGAQLGEVTTIGADSDPVDVRRIVTWAARAAGLEGDVVEDLLLAIGELARVAGTATIRTGRAGGEWFCEVAATGPARSGLRFDENGLGVVIARLLCDSVEVDTTDGVLTRLVFGTPKASSRNRILTAAGDLFATDGVRATGVNAIIAQAGVAKATFYAHFPSKNDVVVAWLQSAPVRWFDGVRTELQARAPSPVERLTLFFDVLGEWLAADGFHGCQTLNTATAARASNPGQTALAELHGEIEEYLRSTATAAGLTDPGVLAAQLLVLVAGTIATATARKSTAPATAARLAANRLVASAS